MIDGTVNKYLREMFHVGGAGYNPLYQQYDMTLQSLVHIIYSIPCCENSMTRTTAARLHRLKTVLLSLLLVTFSLVLHIWLATKQQQIRPLEYFYPSCPFVVSIEEKGQAN